MDIKEKIKQYKQYNKKQDRNEYMRQYRKDKKRESNAKKSRRISSWKSQGILFHDYNLLYEIYFKTTHCDECKCQLTYDRYMRNTTKCLDHDHSIIDDNNVRNILCHCCNNKRR